MPRRDLPHPLHELEALLLVEGKEVEPGIAVVRARQGLELATGRLERVLEPFLPTTPGFFLYFPARAQTQPKLRAFINLAVAMLRRRS